MELRGTHQMTEMLPLEFSRPARATVNADSPSLNAGCNARVAPCVKMSDMSTISEGHVVDGLIDSRGLAARLGVSPATIRSWRSRGASWLPEPIGRLDGLVWREQDVADIAALVPTSTERGAAVRHESRSDRLFQASQRKARGAYYTPSNAALFMARWLVRADGETYLEPSMGDGVFIEAVNDVVEAAGIDRPNWVVGELDETAARDAVSRQLVNAEELRVGDFMEQPLTLVDGAIANPPYVRLRHLDPGPRGAALDVAKQYLGQPMAPSGSIWMPFVLKMVASIRLGGRMAVVLPLDFTYVSYALPLWDHLARSFSSLRVLRSRERVFSDINQDVLILFADGRGGTTDHVTYVAYESVQDLVSEHAGVGGDVLVRSIVDGERAFQSALLPEGLTALLNEGAARGLTVPASTLATFRIGYVAGDKKFFHPSPDTARTFGLPKSHLRPALINARKMRGQGLWTSRAEESATDHLWLPEGGLGAGEKRYVRHGEDLKVNQGYKASLRSPWYRVPGVNEPDAIITVFSERPTLLINDASFVATNSFLCAYTRGINAEQFAAAWYNPLTLLSIGLEVHSLGGGVVVMVPNEASRVSVINPERSTSALPAIDAALRAGDIAQAYEVGAANMVKTFGKEASELIREGISTLSRWRTK